MITNDMNYILKSLKNNRTVEFIYAPKDISKYNKSEFMYNPRFRSWYNKFYLTKSNNKMKFLDENGSIIRTRTPRADAVNLFYDYYEDPDFSTMVALTDARGDNLIFYDSDKGQFYRDYL